ncbi:hypothetical protein F5Y04DRAFT_288362 [Hypomontagnella monticulosa]|nr:hypothetical protein F5Y04DRAFT_288362 [Hypomontagnella monticulosa]
MASRNHRNRTEYWREYNKALETPYLAGYYVSRHSLGLEDEEYHERSRVLESLSRYNDFCRRKRLSIISGVKPSRSDENSETVFTGEYRAPLRERLRKRRQEVQRRPFERYESGSVSDHHDSMTNTPAGSPGHSPRRMPSPATSKSTPPSRPPSAEYLAPELRRLLDRYAKENTDRLFDRCADKQEAASKRSSLDLANERHQKGITAPPSPSPLRRSCNAMDTAVLSSALKKLQMEQSAGRDRDGDAGSIRSYNKSPHGEAPQSWI